MAVVGWPCHVCGYGRRRARRPRRRPPRSRGEWGGGPVGCRRAVRGVATAVAAAPDDECGGGGRRCTASGGDGRLWDARLPSCVVCGMRRDGAATTPTERRHERSSLSWSFSVTGAR